MFSARNWGRCKIHIKNKKDLRVYNPAEKKTTRIHRSHNINWKLSKKLEPRVTEQPYMKIPEKLFSLGANIFQSLAEYLVWGSGLGFFWRNYLTIWMNCKINCILIAFSVFKGCLLNTTGKLFQTITQMKFPFHFF